MWYILRMLVLISLTQCNAHIRLVNPTPRSDDSGIKGPVEASDSSNNLIPCSIHVEKKDSGDLETTLLTLHWLLESLH
jgi:hypothetical protein